MFRRSEKGRGDVRLPVLVIPKGIPVASEGPSSASIRAQRREEQAQTVLAERARERQVREARERAVLQKALEAQSYKAELRQQVHNAREEAAQSTVALLRRMGVVNTKTVGDLPSLARGQQEKPALHYRERAASLPEAAHLPALVKKPLHKQQPRSAPASDQRSDPIREYAVSLDRQQKLLDRMRSLKGYIRDLRGLEQNDDIRRELKRTAAKLISCRKLWAEIQQHPEAAKPDAVLSGTFFQIKKRHGDKTSIISLNGQNELSYIVRPSTPAR